jgi:glycerol uptake facilitator protein
MFYMKKLTLGTAICYWIFQLLGGLVAGAMIYIQTPNEMFEKLQKIKGLGLPTPDPRYIGSSFWTEFMATFLLQIAIMSLYFDKRAPEGIYAIGVGMMMSLGILTIGNVSGGGINPARSFGPSIISGTLNANLVIFFFGPLFGSVTAAFIYKEVFLKTEKKEQNPIEKQLTDIKIDQEATLDEGLISNREEEEVVEQKEDSVPQE